MSDFERTGCAHPLVRQQELVNLNRRTVPAFFQRSTRHHVKPVNAPDQKDVSYASPRTAASEPLGISPSVLKACSERQIKAYRRPIIAVISLPLVFRKVSLFCLFVFNLTIKLTGNLFFRIFHLQFTDYFQNASLMAQKPNYVLLPGTCFQSATLKMSA